MVEQQSPLPRVPVPVSVHNAIIVKSTSQKIKTESASYIPGQFCHQCLYDKETTCGERVKLMTRGRQKSKGEAIAAVIKNAQAKRKGLTATCLTPLHKVFRKEDEPTMILHVGPHKTGTTALQSLLYDLVYETNNGTTLLEDNLRVPTYDELPGLFGKVVVPTSENIFGAGGREGVGLNLPHCSLRNYKESGGSMSKKMCGPMRMAFPIFVHDAYDKSQSILIVAEDFDRIDELDVHRLRYYLQPYKRIQIVVNYRRLHDWLPSWYNQIVDSYMTIYAQGKQKYPNFVEWMEKNYDKFLESHAISVALRYASYDFVESVHLINMHNVSEKNNLVEHFFCDVLQAKAVCRAIEAGATPSKSNVGTDHEYEQLAIMAKLAGKLTRDMTKPQLLHKSAVLLQKKIEETNTTTLPPRICPSNALLEKIFQKELEHEKMYFHDWHESHGGEHALKQSFDRVVMDKFCSLDVNEIISSGLLDDLSI